MSASTSAPPPSRQRERPQPTAGTARTLFEIPFASAMSDRDVALLSRTLHLDTHLHPKLSGSPARPGVARLDFDSGLFLERGPTEGRWLLAGRTWGEPPPSVVQDWALRAAAAARELDPTVAQPVPASGAAGAAPQPAHGGEAAR